MTFDATTTQVATISTDSSLQDQEVEEMDEVSRYSYLYKSLTSGHLDPWVIRVSMKSTSDHNGGYSGRVTVSSSTRFFLRY